MPASLTEAAPAKVNLYLHVLGRRADGYHLLDSLAVFPGVGDVLCADPADSLSLEIVGRFAADLAAGSDNLVLRAARTLAAEAGAVPRGRLVLHKNLPVASGIGGGSADAAAALRLLSRLWGLVPASASLAATLGADVPVCLASRACRMGGVGERLEPAPSLPPCGIALVNPGVAVSTADVFRARRGAWSAQAVLPLAWSGVDAMVNDLRSLQNDLQPPAIALCPAIGEVLRALKRQPGCKLARMSGSGATCFGLFGNEEDARKAAEVVQRPGWWSWGGGLH